MVLASTRVALPGSRQWIGAQGLGACSNYYSMAFGPADASSHEAARPWFEALATQARLVDLSPLDEPVAVALEHCARAAGWACHREPAWVHWTEPVPAQGFEAYWEARPSAMRNTWKRKHAKAVRDQGLKIQIARSPAEVEQAWAAYASVYAASWKQAESHPAFVQALAMQGAKQDLTRLGVAELDGQPAAAQLWFVQDGTALIYKLAYDERFKPASAGLLLSRRMMEYCIRNEAVQQLDYGSGDDPYKRDWMTQRGFKWRLVLAHPTTGLGRVMKLTSLLRRRP
jgi:hypothetical protein